MHNCLKYFLLGLLTLDFYAASRLAAQEAQEPQNHQETETISPDEGLLNADFNKSPTFIKSDTLTLKAQERYVEYRGNVEVKHQDMVMTCETLQALYKEDNSIDKLVAIKDVFIQKGPTIRARGDRALYDHETETITLTETPELQQDGSVLTADKIRIFLREDRSVAEGDVRVKLAQTSEPQDPTQPKKKKETPFLP